MESAVKRAATVRDDHFGAVALGVQSTGTSAGPTSVAWSWSPGSCRAGPG